MPLLLLVLHQTASALSADSSNSDDSIQKRSSSSQQQQQLFLQQQQQKRQLSWDFIAIGLPALLQLAAEPLAGLVDSAYLGRLPAHIMGGAGIALSAQYAVSKLYNDPLLRTSISLVAVTTPTTKTTTTTNDDDETTINATKQQQHDDLCVAVASALFLATVVGVTQLFIYATFSHWIVSSGMGLASSSPMWPSAVGYLRIRALGTPAATLWLVTNGIFRGLGDTRTPLWHSLAFTLLNVVLDPFFIFTLGWGAAGAAAGTALAQYAALVPLLYALHKKVPFWNNPALWQWSALRDSLRQYLQAGGWVLVRTVGKVAAYTVTARYAAQLGAVSAAAYHLTFQLGFATTQICEAVAVAVQTLLARELGRAEKNNNSNNINQAVLIRHLISTSLWLGGGVATLLSLATYAGRDTILRVLTTDAGVRAAAVHIFPAVLVTQVLKGLAYPVNGILMGGLDWIYSMITMWMANVACVGLVYHFASATGAVSLGQLWWALAVFMGTQVVAGIVRYECKTGVWKVLRRKGSESQQPKLTVQS